MAVNLTPVEQFILECIQKSESGMYRRDLIPLVQANRECQDYIDEASPDLGIPQAVSRALYKLKEAFLVDPTERQGVMGHKWVALSEKQSDLSAQIIAGEAFKILMHDLVSIVVSEVMARSQPAPRKEVENKEAKLAALSKLAAITESSIAIVLNDIAKDLESVD